MDAVTVIIVSNKLSILEYNIVATVYYEKNRWFIPIIGHMGICTSSGVIRDFAGPYYVSVKFILIV